MGKPGKYLLIAMLTIMLAVAPIRVVLALSMSVADPCASMTMADHGGGTQNSGHQASIADSDTADQAPDHGCCKDGDHNCSADCSACVSLSFAVTTTPPLKIVRQDLSKSDLIFSVVPLRNLAPLLRPPVTLHR